MSRRSLRRPLLLAPVLLAALACGSAYGTADTSAVADGGAPDGNAAADGSATDAGPACTSLRLDGGSSYAEVAPNPAFDPPTLTVEAWVLSTETSQERHIVAHDEYPTAGWALLMHYGNLEARVFGPTDAGYVAGIVSKGLLTPNVWHHVAFSYDPMNRQIAVFLDGVKEVQQVDGAAYAPYAGPLRFGLSSYDQSFGWAGLIDEVRISSTVRYSSSFTPPYPLPDGEPNTVGVWHLGEGMGTTSAEARGTAGMQVALSQGLAAVQWDKTCAQP